MNKHVLGFIGVLVLFFSIAASMVGYAVWKAGSEDRSSLAWVQTHLPPLLSDWSLAQLKQDASSSYLRELDFRGQMAANFQRWSQLGKLQQLSDLQGQSDITFPNLPSHKDPVYTASYQAHARFAKGQADIDVQLRQENGEWKWQAFTLTPQEK